MVRAIIFDCFGVIIADAVPIICSDLGIKDDATLREISDIIHAMNHGFISMNEGRRRVADIVGIPPDDYYARFIQGEIKDTTLLNYIASLRPRYKTGLLSNVSNKQSLYGRFGPGELERSFDVVVASGDIGFAKPEAQAYQYIADQLGVRLDECVMLDDREVYCEAATAVGMETILYKNSAQAKPELVRLLHNTET